MCLIVSKLATKRMQRKRKAFVAWKVLALAASWHWVNGQYRYVYSRQLQSGYYSKRYKPGINKSNRKSRALTSAEKHNPRIHRGIHVYLDKPKGPISIPVIVHPRDLVAAGTNNGGSKGAVFMKIRIRKADYADTVKALRDLHVLPD